MRFWDSSALVPLHVDDSQTAGMRALLRTDSKVAVWWATPVECASALARRNREAMLSDDEYAKAFNALKWTLKGWRAIRPSQFLRYHAMRFVRIHGLKAADAIQLAAATTWALDSMGGRQFVSLDGRLRAKALLEGFTVLPE